MELLKSIVNLHILITAVAGDSSAVVEIAEEHTNVVRIEKDGKILEGGEYKPDVQGHEESRAFMSIAGILDFAENCNIEDVRDILDKQILCNSNIAVEGLSHQYSMGVGRSLLDSRGSDVRTRGHGGGGGWFGCPHGRQRSAGHHQFRQRQSGHYGFAAGH